MMRRFVRSMGLVLPPRNYQLAVAGAVLCVLLGEWALMAYLSWQMNSPLDWWGGPAGYRVALIFVVAAHAVWRVLAFHPVFHTTYRTWLQTVPWRPGGRLPLGPATVVWQDLVIVATAAALGGQPWCWIAASLALIVPWTLGLSIANFAVQLDFYAFMAALLLVPVIMAEHWPWLALGALPAYAMAAAGLRGCLERYPWDHLPRWRAIIASGRDKRSISLSYAWPQLQLSKFGDVVKAMAWSTTFWWAGLAAALAAALTVMAMIEPAARGSSVDESMICSFRMLCVPMAVGRLVFYCGVCWPPISLAGRLRSGRIVIPSYDKALAAPLLVLLTGWLAPRVIIGLGAPLPFVAAATAAMIVILTFGMGPSLAHWQLTGNYRLFVWPAIERVMKSRR